jgi:hypothetical protein
MSAICPSCRKELPENYGGVYCPACKAGSSDNMDKVTSLLDALWGIGRTILWVVVALVAVALVLLAVLYAGCMCSNAGRF